MFKSPRALCTSTALHRQKRGDVEDEEDEEEFAFVPAYHGTPGIHSTPDREDALATVWGDIWKV